MFEATASLARPPARKGLAPFEGLALRFGGKVALAVFALLLVVVAVVDTFLLPSVMNALTPPRQFATVCEPGSANAGGFAWVFLLSVGLLVLGLSLLAPRAVWIGGLVFVFSLVGQFYVANLGSLTLALERWPLSLMYNVDWFCTDLSAYLQQRYNAPSTWGASQAVINFRFTDMMFFNAILMGAIGILLILMGAIRCAWATVQANLLLPAAREPLAKVLRGPERIVLVQSVTAIALFAMAAPMLLLFSATPADYSEATYDFLWVGPMILLIDLARLMFVPARAGAPRSTTGPDDPAPSHGDLILGKLATNLKSAFDQRQDNIRIDLPKVKTQARPKLEDMKRIPEAGTVVLLKGTLKADNYTYIQSYLIQGVIDRGCSALVICPDDALDSVAGNIRAGLETSAADFGLRTWTVNTPLQNPSGQPRPAIDIVFASPETLGILVTRGNELRAELATLGGVFIFGLHRMDIGLLSLGLRRLRPFVEHPSRMIGVVQSEDRGTLSTVVRQLPLLNELSNTRDIPLVQLDRYSPSHTLVFRPAVEANLRRPDDWPLWVTSLLGVRKTEPRSDAFVFDIDARFPKGVWRESVVDKLDGTEDTDFVNWARNLPTPILSPLAAEHPVAQLHDRGNLADTLRVGIADADAVETLRIILTSDYPGASFLRSEMLKEVARAGKDAEARRQAVASFCETYGSVLPTPRGGPVELSLLVHQEYYSAIRRGAARGQGQNSLSQDHLDRLWEERDGPLEKLGITNTRFGLESLFRQTHKIARSSSFVTRTENEGRRWTYRLADQGLANPDLLAIMTVNLAQGAQLPGGSNAFFPLADHGLSYDRGVRLLIGGNVYRVADVDVAGRNLRVEPDDKPVRPYVFVRDYAFRLDKTDGPRFASDEARVSVEQSQQPYEIVTSYAQIARHTTAHIEHGSSLNAFGAGNEMPEKNVYSVVSDFRLKSVGVLRIYSEGNDAAMPARNARRASRRRGAASGSVADGYLAFTLATSLQDVLALLFRPLAHRIAVVSPDAYLLTPKGQREWGPVSSYCLDRQPAIARADITASTTAQSVSLRHQLSEAKKVDYNAYFSDMIDEAGVGNRVTPTDRTPFVTLAVIEDSDHDLGVVRYLRHQSSDLLQVWSKYLDHYADPSLKRADNDYAFGTDAMPDCYAFANAAEVLRKMQSRKD